MTTCTLPGCGGAVAADGYCDTCGAKASSASGAAEAPPAGGPCAEPGCGGTIAADGYCDTCGMASSSVVPAVARPAAPGGAVAAPPVGGPADPGGRCQQPGCDGTVAVDGYCDTCGMAAVASPIPTAPEAPPSPSGDGSNIPSIAAPSAPNTSSRVRSGSGASPQSRRTLRSVRTKSRRTGIGAGLVEIAPTPAGNPASAVLGEDDIRRVLGEVPEDERFCSSCGRPVGRSQDGRPGRIKGFCGSCRTPFDFVTNEPSLKSGELVHNQYRILGPLAHGGLGWIYLGQDTAVSDRWVVLKGLLNESDPDAVLAAVAERQFLAQIEHANIVNIYNFVTHRGSGYIVMEMVGGESLNDKLKQRRRSNGGLPDPLPPEEAIAYVLGILPAFGYLHQHGLVYNDLKPANIMAVGGDVKLIDVGAVMRIDDQQAAIFGTQGFQAPEVASLGPSVASDLYTIGRTLAVLMLIFQFHDGPYLHALPGRDAEPLFAQWESLHRFLLRACAFHRDDRFQTAAEMQEQLTGVLREMVAVSEGNPQPATSGLFEGDQLAGLLMASADAYDVTTPDWQVLPRTRINEEDKAAPFLATLPQQDPARSLDLLDEAMANGQVGRTPEVLLHKAREQVQIGQDPEWALGEVEETDPWEWRVQWYRAIRQLQMGLAEEAADGFSRVWTELPGETAPKLAVALAAEVAGAHSRAAEIYDLVISTDSSYVSAAFGLARCRERMGDREGMIDALKRVPPSSAAHYDSQVASARRLVEGGPSGIPSVEELREAAATIERLQLDAAERAALSASVFERALAGLQRRAIDPGADLVLLGCKLDERSLRQGLEKAYREQARLTTDNGERIRLVDLANGIRPRSLF
jgi:serine/threonine-protein kinase PknG